MFAQECACLRSGSAHHARREEGVPDVGYVRFFSCNMNDKFVVLGNLNHFFRFGESYNLDDSRIQMSGESTKRSNPNGQNLLLHM